MDTRTGKIHQMDSVSGKSRLGLTPLSTEEHRIMVQYSEEERPYQLALMRFVESRKKLGVQVTTAMRKSYRLGWEARNGSGDPVPVYRQQDHDRSFVQGFSTALGILARAFDQPNQARMVMEQANFSLKDFERAGCEEYDIELIRKDLKGS